MTGLFEPTHLLIVLLVALLVFGPKRLPELGLLANLVEFPAVPKGAARFRMQVMADHTDRNIALAVEHLRFAREEAIAELDALAAPAVRAVA